MIFDAERMRDFGSRIYGLIARVFQLVMSYLCTAEC